MCRINKGRSSKILKSGKSWRFKYIIYESMLLDVELLS
jgi:hypothetical protein